MAWHIPTDGDSLFSLIHALTVLNGYERDNDVLGIWRKRMAEWKIKDRTSLPYRKESFDALSELSKIPSDTLHGMTVHQYAKCIVPPDHAIETLKMNGNAVPLLPQKQLGHHFRSDHSASWCPQCIAEGQSHQSIWQSRFVTMCLRHGCLLEDRCPACDRKVRIFEVCRGRCQVCGTSLSMPNVVAREASPFAFTAQMHVQSWLDPTITKMDDRTVLPDCTPRASYHILFGLYWCISHSSDRLLEHYLSYDMAEGRVLRAIGESEMCVADDHARVAVAFHIISDWPNFFLAFLDQTRLEGGSTETSLTALGAIYMRWLMKEWQHNDFQVVKDAFEQYFNAGKGRFPSLGKSAFVRDNPSFLDSWVYMSVARAAEQLGVTAFTVRRLVKIGRLTDCHADLDSNRFKLVLRSEVEALKVRWSESLSLEEAAQWIGVWHEIVADLAREGLLEAERGPVIDGSQEWRFVRLQVDDFLARIERHVRHSTLHVGNLGERFSLTDAVRMLTPVEMTLVRLIKHVLDGELPLCRFESKTGGFDELQVTVADVERLKERLRQRRGWVFLYEIAQRMGVKDTVAARWVNRGLLTPVAHVAGCVYFDAAQVEEFVASHVFTTEAVGILGVGKLVVQKWSRNGRLIPISGPGIDECHRYLYRRQDVERLRPANRLTAPEVAEQLGISRSTVGEWMKQGKLKPISGPEIDGSKHYLFLKDELI